ncbi:MAG: phytoene desaturase [Bacteroidetes bacterium]|nr:phytoene desaturase [Bacteroidota bacterium]
MHQTKVIVIGAGVAGLATAIRLAAAGDAVTVYEKNEYPGGKLSAFEKDGYHFDAGPSLFTQPQLIEELFALAGEPIENYFQYRRVPVACKYFFADGKMVEAFADAEQFDAELQDKLQEPAGAVTCYLQESKKIYDNIGSIFLNHSLHKRKTWLNKRVLKAIQSTKRAYLFKSMHQHNQHAFKTADAVQLFNRYATYNGSNPYQAPGMLSLIPHLEYNEGVYYPEGGMISITNALYQLAVKLGVQFHFNTEVQYIINNEGRARGVVVKEENIEADMVVSNVDVYFTYKKLLRDELSAKKVLRQERSSSALVFYWGIAKTFDALQLHNIFFSADYEKEFDALFNKKQLQDDPTVYMNITSKMQKGLAPEGKENWFVMINAPANTGQDWAALQQEARKKIIAKLNVMLNTDIEQYIETETMLDPTGIEAKTASYMGSLYGTSSNSKLAAFLRHPNFNSNIKGLYCVGGSVHPGGGIPLCLKSAQIVTHLIKTQKRVH